MASDSSPRIVEAGDSVLIVEFEERIDAAVNQRAVTCAQILRRASLPGIRDIVPTFRSVAIYFDPLKTNVERLRETVDASVDVAGSMVPPRTPIKVPVCYGGAHGPDLGQVAAFAGLSEAEVIDLHAARIYHVFMLGFLPGFAYMGTVDQRIAAPRRATPRVHVPAGSVGIAGAQTGIYPSSSPGGWQLIGMTPLKPFDRQRPEPFLFAAGDAVQFYPIEVSELERAETA